MNAKSLFIAAALSTIAATGAMAGEITPDTFPNTASTLTRAEVIAEYVRAKNAGELDWANHFHNPNAQRSASNVTRAEVVAEYLRARKAGEIAEANLNFTVPHLRRAMQ